jgi:hypothetical protein
MGGYREPEHLDDKYADLPAPAGGCPQEASAV